MYLIFYKYKYYNKSITIKIYIYLHYEHLVKILKMQTLFMQNFQMFTFKIIIKLLLSNHI
jgi:hypothetical protein